MASKYTKSARGQDCTVRIPLVCNGNNETTVAAHISGGGMGAKASDIHIAYTCSSCHDAIDGRVITEYPRAILDLWHHQGVVRTQEIMMDKELLKL